MSAETPAPLDQLEIVDPAGQVRFVALRSDSGVLNLGSDSQNDICLPDGQVPAFWALLDLRQRPYRRVDLADGGGAQAWPLWEPVAVGGYTLILVESVPPPPPPRRRADAAARPTAASPALAASAALAAGTAAAPIFGVASFQVRPPDKPNDVIVVDLPQREWTIDVEQTAAGAFTLTNGGDRVANFDFEVVGLDSRWVTFSPREVNLYVGAPQDITFTLTAPRQPTSLAGPHHFLLRVTSPQYPQQSAELGATLTLNPYYDPDVGQLSPADQTTTYSRPAAQTKLTLANYGNAEAVFQLDAEDTEHACVFEFQLPGSTTRRGRPTELRLRPNEAADVVVHATPLQRQVVALRPRLYSYKVTANQAAAPQGQETRQGSLRNRPLIDLWLLFLLLLGLTALLASVVIVVFWPTVTYFGDDPQLSVAKDSVNIQGGDSLTLYWQASTFAEVRLLADPPDDQLADTAVARRDSRTVSPAFSANYTLAAENFLTQVSPPWLQEFMRFKGEFRRTLRVTVGAVPPEIVKFALVDESGTPITQLVRGQTATLLWEVDSAETLVLRINDAPETLPTDQHVGSRVLTPETTTSFVLQAYNKYRPDTPVFQSLTVVVQEPTPTPPPTPGLGRFVASPLVITAGETVRLEWSVTGVEKVTIQGLTGDFGAQGSTEVKPTQDTVYTLIAVNSAGVTVRATQEVKVNPAPLPPVITSFQILPPQALPGGQVKVTWVTTGQVTRLELTTADNVVVPLNATATEFLVSATATGFFKLRACNGALCTDAEPKQFLLLPTPTPPPTLTPPPTATVPPPAPLISLFDVLGPSVSTISATANARIYAVDANTPLTFTWQVANTIQFRLQDPNQITSDLPLPSGTRLFSPAQKGTFILTASNVAGVTTQLFVEIRFKPKPVPPAPENVTGVLTTTAAISWTYDLNQLSLITDFVVYRSVGGGPFLQLGNPLPPTIRPGPPPHFQADDPLATCGMAYYVVARYIDENGAPQQTPPSTSSWNTPPCPAARLRSPMALSPPAAAPPLQRRRLRPWVGRS